MNKDLTNINDERAKVKKELKHAHDDLAMVKAKMRAAKAELHEYKVIITTTIMII